MTTYEVEQDKDGKWKIYQVSDNGMVSKQIALCKDRVWADRIVNALNQMEIEG
jgi:hypothetical protein